MGGRIQKINNIDDIVEGVYTSLGWNPQKLRNEREEFRSFLLKFAQEVVEYGDQRAKEACAVQGTDKLKQTNEELKLANEELKHANKERKQTKEELKQANEERKQTNEELKRVNEELTNTQKELKLANDRLKGIDGFIENGSADSDESSDGDESL